MSSHQISSFSEVSAVCAALITTLDQMLRAEHFSDKAFHATAGGAFGQLEELRLQAQAMPSGPRKELAYETISVQSTALNRVMVRKNHRVETPIESVEDKLFVALGLFPMPEASATLH